MARTALSDVQAIPDPALVWNFDLLLPAIPGSSNTSQLTYRCMSTGLPGSQLMKVDVQLHGVHLVRRGARDWSHAFSSTFLEAVDWNTRNAFFNWMEAAQSWVNNTGSPSSTYLANGQIVLYTDAPAVAKTVQVIGMWPEQINDVTMDGAQGGAHVSLEIQWAYDYTIES
jgi:hypothetical protein